MFIYCGNDPVCYSDHTGELPLINLMKAEGNEGDIENRLKITDQTLELYANKKYGISNVGHSGCAAVATYNAAVELGLAVTFDDVLDYYNAHSYEMVFWGLAGTLPTSVKSFFEYYGYTVYLVDDIDGIDALSTVANASILWYLYPTDYAFGGHFEEYHRTDGNYKYSASNSSGSCREYERFVGTCSFNRPSAYAYDGNFYAIGVYIFK